MSKTKPFKLRAFKITNLAIDVKGTSIKNLLCQKLSGSLAKNRRLLINPKDPAQEEDLISDFILEPSKYVTGAMLRIRPSDDIKDIPDSLFDSEIINLESLEDLQTTSSIIYKEHYYFLINDKYLICTLHGTKTITNFQTYINWILQDLRENSLFEFTPIVSVQPNLRLSDIKSLKVFDPDVNESNNFESKTRTQKNLLPLHFIKEYLRDVNTLDETTLSEVISAELVIKFSKPSTISKEEYQNTLGALLKPISDTDNITIYPKKGRPISGKDVLKIKEVNIETTESNQISRTQLIQEMERFVLELENEENN